MMSQPTRSGVVRRECEQPFNHCAQAFVRISISESTFMALRLQAAAEMARYIMLKCEPLCFFYSMSQNARKSSPASLDCHVMVQYLYGVMSSTQLGIWSHSGPTIANSASRHNGL
jgi:hypothetical protein